MRGGCDGSLLPSGRLSTQAASTHLSGQEWADLLCRSHWAELVEYARSRLDGHRDPAEDIVIDLLMRILEGRLTMPTCR